MFFGVEVSLLWYIWMLLSTCFLDLMDKLEYMLSDVWRCSIASKVKDLPSWKARRQDSPWWGLRRDSKLLRVQRVEGVPNPMPKACAHKPNMGKLVTLHRDLLSGEISASYKASEKGMHGSHILQQLEVQHQHQQLHRSFTRCWKRHLWNPALPRWKHNQW